MLEYRVNSIWTGFSPDYDYSKTTTAATTEELRSYHNMEHFVSELILAPKFVINTLCIQTKMNTIPVTLKPVEKSSHIVFRTLSKLL